MAQVPIRNKGDNQCPHHDTEVILACLDCGGELVCSKCIISKHQRHSFEDISQVATKKKHKIQEYVRTLEKTQLRTVTNNLKSVDQQIKENTNHFQSLQKQITSHGEKMKKEIDRFTKEMIEKCQELEKENSELLTKYKQDLQYLHTRLHKAVVECKNTLEVDNNIMLIDTEKDIQQELKLPNVPKCKTAKFTAGSRSSKNVQDDFGSLSVEEGQASHYDQKSDVVKQHTSSDSTIVSEFTHSTVIRSVEKSTSDSVWLSYYNAKDISHVTTQGEVKQKLELGSNVLDISVSPVTGNLWMCCDDNGVYEVSGNKPTKRFTNDSKPLSLCVTPDNNVVVGNRDDHIKVYSTTGQVLHSTQRSGSVVFPHRLTVCISTGNIAVCDSDMSNKGGDGKPHVSVFNSKLDLKYQYYGPPASVMKSGFYPNDAVYDTQGRILIADNYNKKCIQLVSGEGQFITVVHTDSQQPWALTTIQDGLLCVCFDGKKVKVIRYRV